MSDKIDRQRGQIALIALLVLTIATTVGLSLIARTTTDITVTRNLEDSNRAFSAAEAGIEETLKSGVSGAATVDSAYGVSYTVTTASFNGTAGNPFVFPQKTPNEQTETVWLVNHSGAAITETPTYTGNSIDVCWSSEPVIPALVVSILYKKASDGTYQMAKQAYDPNSARALSNNFSAPTATTGGCGVGTNTTYKSTIQFSSLVPSVNPAADTIIFLRIRPVYNGTQIAVGPVQDLPIQGNRIESLGQTASGVNRKIIVYKQYRSPDSVFDYAVFSQGSFLK